VELTFLGATGTVTGSKYLLRASERAVMVDCGLFQGLKQLRLRNWAPLPVGAKDVDAVVLTHAHLDHTGYLPLFVKQGFSGPVHSSPATAELCAILLPDSGHLQEEQARYANKRGFSKHKPALPLYTVEDAQRCLKRFVPVRFGQEIDVARAFKARLVPAGHILGASIASFSAGRVRIAFSGDLGRTNDAVMRPPSKIEAVDYLVVESTYGNRRHPSGDAEEEFASHLNRALARGGVVVVPSFAVGRAQTLLYFVARLKARKAIPDVPVFLNSPMAVNATRIYHEHRSEHRLTQEECTAACSVAKTVTTPEESKALNARGGPMIIISASGMATGGRVVHHIKAFAPDPRNMILLPGFQAAGTRGASLAAGAEAVKIHGEYIPVRAEVVKMDSLSAHADYAEILDWLKGLPKPPRETFVTHGEPAAADEMRRRIEETLGWKVRVPEFGEKVTLG
jgi:metallo-beta-lactamase family protein